MSGLVNFSGGTSHTHGNKTTVDGFSHDSTGLYWNGVLVVYANANYQPETNQFYNRANELGLTISNTDLIKINSFISGLKSNNLWSKITEIGIFKFINPLPILKLKHNSFDTLINNGFLSSDYNSFIGLTGRSGTYLDGRYVPNNTNGQNLHLACWSSDWNGRTLGWHKPSVFTSHYLVNENASWFWGNSGSVVSNSNGGFRIATRSTGNALLYLNGSLVSTHTTPDNSVVPQQPLAIFASRGEDGSIFGHTTATLRYYSVGSFLTAPEISTYYNLVNTLLS